MKTGNISTLVSSSKNTQAHHPSLLLPRSLAMNCIFQVSLLKHKKREKGIDVDSVHNLMGFFVMMQHGNHSTHTEQNGAVILKFK